MKLTFPIVTLCRGGAQRVLVELVNGLSAAGHHVQIVMPPSGVVEFDVQVPIAIVEDLADVDAYPGGDVIVSNWYTTVAPANHASLVGKGHHVRFAMCYEPLILEADVPSAFRSYVESARLIVLSRAARDLVRVLHGIDARVVSPAVGPQFRDLGIRDRGPLTVAAVARGGITWHRDLEYLMAVLAHVRSVRPDVRIRVVCPPGELAAAKDQLVPHGRSPVLRKLEAVRSRLLRRAPASAATGPEFVPPPGWEVVAPRNDAELCEVYSSAHVFVASSVHGSFDLPPLEAMRCGAATAAVYSGGNADYLRHGDTGLLSYRHEQQLASDVMRLLDDERLCRNISAAGKREAETWTPRRMIGKFIESVGELTSASFATDHIRA